MKQKLREYLWLVMFILCMIAGTHKTIQLGIKQSYIFFVLAIFALIFFLIRRNIRKKELEK